MATRPLLLGHRGVRGEKSIPENSLASFDLAVEQGCDGFEFDVRLTADGQAVVCHDAASRGQEIAASSAEELGLASLRDVLKRYQGTAFLDIELKVPRLEAIAADLLRLFPPLRGFVVSSFLAEVIKTARSLNPDLPLGLICETRQELIRWRELPVEYVIPHHKLLRRNLVTEMKEARKKTLVWTVNAPGEMKRFSNWGVDGVISDNPKQLLRASG